MSQLKTVKVADANPRGWKIINATDFDADKHTVFDAAPKAAKVTVKKSTVSKAKTKKKA